MTYNFDPDRWLDNELAALDAERAAGRLTEADCEQRKENALDRYHAMLDRLDGTYRIDDHSTRVTGDRHHG